MQSHEQELNYSEMNKKINTAKWNFHQILIVSEK